MQQIFLRAVNVQVYLGDDSLATNDLISAIKDGTLLNVKDRAYDDPKYQKYYLKFKAFGELEYWGRTWIIQEIALARNVRFISGLTRLTRFTMEDVKVLCGKAERAEWRGRSYDRLKLISDAFDLLSLATTESVEEHAKRLTKLLQMSRKSRCSDPRDRIYGLLGIMTAMFGTDFLEASYERTLVDVYTDFTRRFITTTGSLVILNQSAHIYNSITALPTWVPDWSSRFDHESAVQRIPYHEKFHASGKLLEGRYRPSPGYTLSSKLNLSGFLFGHVRVVGSHFDYTTDQYRLLKNWEKLHSGAAESFRRTVTLDDSRLGQTDLDHAYLQIYDYNRLPLDVNLDRRFFVSDRGMPGVGPMDTREGDLLAILAGGKVPYVLRKSPNATTSSPNEFTFVGESYVDGVMYGELLDSHDFEDIVLV
ncbi:hypothetical protein PV08_05261 [Exophiala spinifera]|uniref:Heterokaryon incompatibility domain-containing protein n=1 Tax=Exophiala spinifera TaxID=91928 RepID=A0A0D1YJR0_9EURO|nr:uncharacterized protein PV08_05261 [Exophiala spinifera]KIW15216.1 hypothetical protein PV08_05261 [Exophiala spinifera]